MAYEIVDGRLVKITDKTKFGTPAQRKAGRRITGTLGLPQTKEQAAKQLSQTFAPPPAARKPSAPITLGRGPVTPPTVGQAYIDEFGNQAVRQVTLPPPDPYGPKQATRQIFQSPDTALRTGQIQPTAPAFLSPGAAQAARFQGITPSSIIPQVEIRQPLPAVSPVSQLASPFTGRQPSATGAPPTPDLTPGGREIRHRPAVTPAPALAIPPGTEQQLSYLDTLRATDPERALEVARFQSATIGRNTPESALATNVFFTEYALFDLGQLPRNATEQVWDVIAQRAGYEGTGADLLEERGYIPIGGGMWFLPDGGNGGDGGGDGAFGPITSRAPIFSGRPGRYSGTRGASLGLTNWRI